MDTSSSLPSIAQSDSLLKHDQGLIDLRPNQSLAAGSVRPIGGDFDVSTSSWAVTAFRPSQNAISALLEPPIVGTGLQPHKFATPSSLHKTPTARDIPPVALTNIRHIEAAEFKPYISQVGPLYNQLQRVKNSDNEVWARRERKSYGSFAGDEESPKAGTQPHSTQADSVGSITSVTTPSEGLSQWRESGITRSKGHVGPPPLSNIPDIYFDEDFHLENPRTFDVVSERSDVVPPASATEKASNRNAQVPRKSLATNAILQEKLSWYMDMVEVHLINSIFMASTTFFSALNSLRELHLGASESVREIQMPRQDLASLENDVVTKGLELLRKQQRLHNLQQLNDVVQQLKRVMDGVACCESLVDEGEIEKALVEIDAIELLMAGERDDTSGSAPLAKIQLRDIRGAAALQGVSKDLTILRLRISKMFESKLHSQLIGDLRRHVQSVSTQEVLFRWETDSLRAKRARAPEQERSAYPTYMGKTEELRTALLPNISGLYRTGSISKAIQAYRELVLREIRDIVRQPLPSSTEDTKPVMSASTTSGGRSRTNQEKPSPLAQKIRALDAEDAEKLFATIYVSTAETLRRLKAQSSVLLDIACSIGSPDAENPANSPTIQSPIRGPGPVDNTSTFEIQDEMHAALDLSDLLGQAVDLSHGNINKILRVRSEQVMGLSRASFLRYFTLNLFFANECEAISGRAGTSLKSVVNIHTNDFIEAYGDRETQTLARGMDADGWQKREFTARDDGILKQVLECSTLDPAAWTEISEIWTPPSQERAEDAGSSETGAVAKDRTRCATIEEEMFSLPRSAILCLEGVSHFLRLMGGVPFMTPNIATSLASYLRMFESRCRQLILGGGARHSAGLKRITAKHLALASQALAFIATIIPHVREFVRRHIPAGRPSSDLMGEFDKVRRAFQEQESDIYQKLVEIMESRALMLFKKAHDTEWDKESSQGTRKYMVDLTKDTGELHNALSKHLPERAVELVMVPVFKTYRDQLGKVFEEAGQKTEIGRDCMLRDVEHLIGKLGKMEGFGDLGTSLVKIIQGKEVKISTPTDEPSVPTKE